MKWFLIPLFFFPLLGFSDTETTNGEVFSRIYQEGRWGFNGEGEAHSGGGSTAQHTALYRQFLQNFLQDHGIKSVVDLGCGDWEFSRMICWDEIDYRGYDVVPSVIEKNRIRYQKEKVQFFVGDGTVTDLPAADLLICKDVLQHLPYEDIQAVIQQLPKYQYCLITNDVDSRTLSSHNPQTNRGGYRPIDLTAPPFFLSGTKILSYRAGPDLKQVLLIVGQSLPSTSSNTNSPSSGEES